MPTTKIVYCPCAGVCSVFWLQRSSNGHFLTYINARNESLSYFWGNKNMYSVNVRNMKIIAFGASYSRDSINRKFASYATEFFPEADVEILDLRDFDLPLYTSDVEAAIGHPQAAHDFLAKVEEADLLIVSLAEHNGSYTAAFKNLFDWTSRIKAKLFEGKKMLLLATAPGPRGGKSVLQAATQRFPVHGSVIVGTFSLPLFRENFSEEAGILDSALKEEFERVLATATNHLNETEHAGLAAQ